VLCERQIIYVAPSFEAVCDLIVHSPCPIVTTFPEAANPAPSIVTSLDPAAVIVVGETVGIAGVCAVLASYRHISDEQLYKADPFVSVIERL
jgi:hypothetical protein